MNAYTYVHMLHRGVLTAEFIQVPTDNSSSPTVQAHKSQVLVFLDLNMRITHPFPTPYFISKPLNVRWWHYPLCGEKPKSVHPDKSLVTSDTLKLFFRSVSTANNEEGILERGAGGAAVVHQGSVFGCLCG